MSVRNPDDLAVQRQYVGDGWQPLVDEAIGVLDGADWSILQIKEKFGGLRFYVEVDDRELHAAILAVEDKSFTICETCGSTEGVETRGQADRRYGWLRTLCAVHHAERDGAGGDRWTP